MTNQQAVGQAEMLRSIGTSTKEGSRAQVVSIKTFSAKRARDSAIDECSKINKMENNYINKLPSNHEAGMRLTTDDFKQIPLDWKSSNTWAESRSLCNSPKNVCAFEVSKALVETCHSACLSCTQTDSRLQRNICKGSS